MCCYPFINEGFFFPTEGCKESGRTLEIVCLDSNVHERVGGGGREGIGLDKFPCLVDGVQRGASISARQIASNQLSESLRL